MLSWLLDDVAGRGRRRRGHSALPATDLDSECDETTALRRAIAARARARDAGVVVIDDYRGDKFAVPQLLIFEGTMVGVWAYGDNVTSYRTIRLKRAHRALDVVAIVTEGQADWQLHVEPSNFPNIVDVEATWSDALTASFRAGSDQWSESRRPAFTLDDGASTIEDVLAFLRSDERAAIERAPASVGEARSIVRSVVSARPPAKPRMVERVIRAALRPWIAQRAVGPGTLIGELDVDGAIADEVVAAPDGLHVYEIKGESDTFKRLKEQGRVYERVATSVTLVVARRHCARALSDEVPPWWGVIVMDGDPTAPIVRVEREPKPNVTGRDAKSMLRALRATDLAQIARGYGLRRPDRIGKERLALLLAERLSLDVIAFEFGRALAHRYRGLRKSELLRLDAAWPLRAGDALNLFAEDGDLTRRMQREERIRQLGQIGRLDLIDREFPELAIATSTVGPSSSPPPGLFDATAPVSMPAPSS